MLTSYLKSGQTVDFAIDNTMPYTVPTIEMICVDTNFGSTKRIKLSPIEALNLRDNINRLTEYLSSRDPAAFYHSTNAIQEETNDRIETAHMDVPLQLGDEGQQAESLDRGGANGSHDHPAVQSPDQTDGETDMRGAQFRPDAGGHILNLHPRAEQLLAGANVPIPPVDVPSFINVEIDDEWQAHISAVDGRRDEVSAALNQDWDEADRWQREVDDFVDALILKPSKVADTKTTIDFNVVSPPVSDADDELHMPLTVSFHPWIKSHAMRKLIVEVFAQGFRYGARWETSK